MRLKKVILKHFKNFNNAEYSFRELTLIEGENGSGKTTLAVDSLLFALYGYSEQSLDTLVSKGKKSCSVMIEIDNLRITREFPTNIKIEELINNDYQVISLANNKEKQNYLNDLFKNIDYFRKFRLMDVKQGINILEEGKTGLLKSLFSFNQDYFNNIRQNLLNKKHQRELLNKDKAVVYHFFPSQKRLDVLNMSILDLSEQVYELDKDINSANNQHREITNQKAGKTSLVSQLRIQKEKVLAISCCPTCKRQVDEITKQNLLKEINDQIIMFNTMIENLIREEEEPKDLLGHLQTVKTNLHKTKDKLSNLRLKLETRLKQKEYIFTNKDIIVINSAIKELDMFCAKYITEWVKVLEPIINDIVSKIGFSVRFDLNEKGSLNILLTKDGYEYSYKDLSSGQRLILSIAFQIALLLEKGEEGLIIADEGFSSLDEQNLQHIFDLFKQIPFQLVCIIHRLADAPENSQVIKL